MIVLHQFAPAFGLPNASPFCMKVETWLRIAGLPFTLDNRASPLKAPKGKLPYIDDDGEAVADSGLIIAHLVRRHRVDPDAALDAAERAVATAFTRLLEEHLYWAAIYTRWIDDAGWQLTREAFFGRMPAPMRQLVPMLVRRNMRRQLWDHGLGRHSRDEIMTLGIADLDAVADFLGDKPFLMGDQATTVDATAYAFLANLLWVPLDSPLRAHGRRRTNLEAYCQRMRAAWFEAADPAAEDVARP